MVYYWLKNNLFKLLPQPCLLCGDTGYQEQDLAVCKACLHDLPVLGETCLCCANPLDSQLERLAAFVNTSPLLQVRYCGQCLQNKPYFEHTLVFFPYIAPFNHLIHAMKFRSKLAITSLLGKVMAQQIANTINTLDELPDGLLPVPLHSSRQRERGYNQALELARPIAKQLQLPLLTQFARRPKPTPPQSSLSFQQRKQNLENAFDIVASVKGMHIAIIDDVMTSGSTVNALAKKLKQAGAQRVSIWCLCRSEPPS